MRHFGKVWNTVSCSYILVDGDHFWLTSVLLSLLRMRNNLCNWSMQSNFCMLLAEDAIWMSSPACQSRIWPHAHKGTPLIRKRVGSPNKGEKASQWPGVPSTRARVLRAHRIADCILPHTQKHQNLECVRKVSQRGNATTQSLSLCQSVLFAKEATVCLCSMDTFSKFLNQTKHLIITVYFWTTGRSTVLLLKLNMNTILQLRKKGLWCSHLLFFFEYVMLTECLRG